jgi:hypothetical protein
MSKTEKPIMHRHPLDNNEAIKRASRELSRLCEARWKGGDAWDSAWHWSIPANPAEDTDLLIQAGLNAAKDLAAELEHVKEQLAKSCLEGRGDPEYPACSRAKETESELERMKAETASALHAARLEGAREALHVAFMVGACWCADQKAEAARIVESRWPSTVEKKKEG